MPEPGSEAEAEAGDLTLRPAFGSDLPMIAEVHLRSRRAAYPAMPAGVHSDDEVRGFTTGWDLEQREVWVAESRGGVVGFAALLDDWLDFLFVLPSAAGQGVGSALLEVAKSRRPGGFGLWVFASNTPARAFYAARGFVEGEHTDGRDNEERSPDLTMHWPGSSH